MSYALWHQPEYGAALRTPDRAEDRHRTTRPRRRRPRRRLGPVVLVLALLAGLFGLDATDTPAASGPAKAASTPHDRSS